MRIEFVLILNFIFIPFLNEIEKIAALREVKWHDFIFLVHTRKERWFVGFLIFLGILCLIMMVPSPGGKIFFASTNLIIVTVISQIFIWGYAWYRYKKIRDSL